MAHLRSSSKIITISPTVDTSAYSSGDVISTVQTITDAVLSTKGTAILQSLAILDKSNQKAAIDLVFFNEAPENSIGADNAAYGLNDADISKVIGRISVAAGDYVSSGTNNAEATVKAIGLLLQSIAGSKNLYMAIIARGAATYEAASNLIIKLGFLQD